ncbi:MAG: thiol reductant ABC exporter subunit CydD [Acidobacteria bacterium]|nr:thiol reductant ABC exporter subunit CydD [Acidobacteriota bacterium]
MLLHRRLVPGAGRARRDLLAAIVLGALAGAILVFQAALLARIVDRVFLHGDDLGPVARVLGLLAGVALLRAVLTWATEVLARRAAASVKADLRHELARAVVARGPAAASRQSVGEIATILGSGLDAVDAYVAQYLPQAALALIVPGFVLAVVLFVDPLSALVLAVTFPLIPLFMYLVGSSADIRARRQWTEMTRLGARFLDALQALPTLRAFGRADQETRTVAAISDRFRTLTMSVLRLAFVSSLVLELLATLGTAIVAVEVGLRLLYARLAFFDALFVLLLAPEFYRPLRALGAAFHAGMAGREAAAHVDRWLGEGRAAEARAVRSTRAAAAAGHPAAAPRIAFERVSVHYGPDRPPALDGVAFEMASGTTTALVGPSGAGKTTVANLLLRFVEAQAGRILVDGVPLDRLDAQAWRARVAWVPQQPHLFHGTLRDNVLLARPGASDEDLRRAASLAHVDEFVARLPLGWATPVGERGARLSGGQRQRVALARAFLRDAPLVVLDEPTAQLDAEHEALIVEAMAALRRGRTCLLVAHRLTTVFDADLVVLLSGGRVVERGTPRDLLAHGQVYARLVEAYGGGA